MNVFQRCLAIFLVVLAGSAPLLVAQAAVEGKTTITRLSDLPTHTYTLPAKPSVMVRDPAAVVALAEAIEKDIRSDLATYDIQDATAVRRMHSSLKRADVFNDGQGKPPFSQSNSSSSVP